MQRSRTRTLVTATGTHLSNPAWIFIVSWNTYASANRPSVLGGRVVQSQLQPMTVSLRSVSEEARSSITVCNKQVEKSIAVVIKCDQRLSLAGSTEAEPFCLIDPWTGFPIHPHPRLAVPKEVECSCHGRARVEVCITALISVNHPQVPMAVVVQVFADCTPCPTSVSNTELVGDVVEPTRAISEPQAIARAPNLKILLRAPDLVGTRRDRTHEPVQVPVPVEVLDHGPHTVLVGSYASLRAYVSKPASSITKEATGAKVPSEKQVGPTIVVVVRKYWGERRDLPEIHAHRFRDVSKVSCTVVLQEERPC
jgi:hypothetical protein